MRRLLTIVAVTWSFSFLHAATFTVTSTSASGAGSFSQAVQDANATPGSDSIVFALAGPVPVSVPPPQHPITDTVSIDGTTQPGFAGSPVVVVSMPAWGCDSIYGHSGEILAFRNGSGGSIVRGLALIGGGVGIRIGAPNVTVAGNYIGLDPGGSAAPVSNCTGISLDHLEARIGGTTASDRNVISGSRHSGITIDGGGSGSTISGNYIGTNAAGNASVPNGHSGIEAAVSGMLFSHRLTVGGTEPGAGNVISGNSHAGIAVWPTSTSLLAARMEWVIAGNRIGVDATGTSAVPNEVGISMESLGGGVIGGNTPAARNIISGNRGHGLRVHYFGPGRGHPTVTGNYIGVAADGETLLGNGGDGIHATFHTNSHYAPGSPWWPMIGGLDAASENRIRGNAGNGITHDAPQLIRRNSISDNGLLGIAGHEFISAWSVSDRELRRPVLNSVVSLPEGTQIRGALLELQPSTAFAVDIYDNAVCDASGYGEARDYVATTTVTTDSMGNADFTVTVPEKLHVVTAIATGPTTSTGISACAVAAAAVPAVTPLGSALLAGALAALGLLVVKAR